MARNIFATLKYDNDGTDSFIIDPSDSQVVDIDLRSANNAQFIVQGVYDATDGTTGITVQTFYGIGPADDGVVGFSVPCVLGGVTNPDIYMSSNYDSITVSPVFTPSSGVPVTRNIFFTGSELRTALPRWLRIKITNTDAVNAVTIKIVADL